ncbi:Bro-N domain-containing protein [Novosphingobium olei]|uniref:Bro-N domain-containing protein n=1 Tax=Novosphingobium olei TaxID=2728851 RepID=A0A7Y0BLF4_9SPHN|nr:BRO family protein [Novosphingobium olei]NML92368.1 hypothetical protein [Novosphingobium olei]
MNTNVIPMFAFNDQQLRGIKIDGEPWFVGVDACRCVGLDISAGAGQHTSRLDADEKRTIRRKGVMGESHEPSVIALFGKFDSQLVLVSRPGLFKLIQRSNKPEAKAFDRYVRHEVLPQIMDSGVAPRTSWG